MCETRGGRKLGLFLLFANVFVKIPSFVLKTERNILVFATLCKFFTKFWRIFGDANPLYYWRTFILTKCVIYCCTYIIYSIYISLSIFTSMYVLAHVNLLKILLFKWTIDSVACSFNLFFILVHKQMQIENMKICICNNNIIPPNIVTVPINLLQILSLSLSTYCK